MIVIDASVAVKWLCVEIGSDQALALLDAPDGLLAPDIFAVEVAAAVTRKVRTGEMNGEEARRACGEWRHSLDAGHVELIPSGALLQPAIDLALQIKHPLQDCLYVALAQRFDCALATSDPKLAARARTVHPRVAMIGE